VIRGAAGPGRGFAVTVVITGVVGLLPVRWLLPWTNDLSALLWLPLRPPAHALTALRLWLRPLLEDPGKPRDAQLLLDERDRFRALWHAERLRAEELAQRLSELERTRQFNRGGSPTVPLLASVTGRGMGGGERYLTLNVGVREGVRPGDPAVVGGDLLVGRVVGEPLEASCWLAPLGDPSTGRLDVYIAPADRPEAPPAESAQAQLRPDARGVLVGEVETSGKVREGDVVRLNDATWKPSARGMRLGVVRSIRASDRNPLRMVIELGGGLEADRLREVTLKVEASE